jgi:exopolysaccharide biosynthesis polyprenyl glycosylphosphotransferase
LLRAGLLHFAREQVQERIAFAGWGRRLERVLNGLKYNLGSLQQVLGFIEVPGIPSSIFTTKTNYLPVGQLKDLEEILKRDRISLMIVDDNCLEHEEMQEIAAICSRCLVSMNVVPRSFDIWLTQLSFQVVGGVPLMGIHGLRHSRLHNRMIKRTVDIVGGLVGLLLSAPIMLICAYLIKRESPGPIFYSQTRLGRGGRPFTIYKLRSMRVDAEKDNKPGWTIENDPRRLKIGTFMRKWNIDETPQFWNVLKGDMSLVGPRPERPELAEAFSKTIRHYNLRHTCKPGVTGWAAVNGLRGNTSLVDRLEYDLFYLENWDVLFDFKIMFFTFFPSENAY